ncbi:MAG: GTP cyclohydrolase I, partial [Gemmatimonadetes bacterium]|nr:GTP cyclohydrolase I [Gemmatimonadota bacterium]
MSDGTEAEGRTGAEFADLVRGMLEALGEDPERDGLLKTPERVEKSLR